ncbi:MAG TPA: hypothetical protein PKB09_02715 [Candidatus Saccharibacteria bacterium]|nr:hypothetical protein [Candidatus Saccharibacteria bacterium]
MSKKHNRTRLLLVSLIIGSVLNIASLLYKKDLKTGFICEETRANPCPNIPVAKDGRGFPIQWLEQPSSFYGSVGFADKEVVVKNFIINEIVFVTLSYVGVVAITHIRKKRN